MWTQHTLVIAFRATIATLVLTGLAYPLAVTGLAQLFFPAQANGSLIRDERGQAIGSELIGQMFKNPAFFQSRPSAAGASGYDASSSSGSNLGPTSRRLRERVTAAVKLISAANDTQADIPADLVTASGSGLDPHISPAAAFLQIARVAAARRIDPARLRVVVEAHIDERDLGFLGEPRVNVLELNLALKALEEPELK
jgi:potassium-transporting ATPase KdpC subunit